MSRLVVISCDTDVDPPTSDGADPVPLAARGEIGYPGWLADRYGRRLRYLRLSVTDRCDLRCQYCMPVEGIDASPKPDVLTIEELVRVVQVFHHLGVRTVRLTGGEPLVRKGLAELVRKLRDEVGITDIAMTTNATAMKHVARELVDAGLARVNVSVDSVRPDTFRAMTRGGELERVIAGIDALRDAGIGELKINAVVVRGMNDDQLGELVDWAWARDLVPRFIELMPLGEGAKLGRDAVVPIAEMKARLADHIVDERPDYRLDRGPAGYVAARDGSGRSVGFIGAVTDNFCHRCNRVRVTARGEVRACLASPSGLSLRDLMREGHSDEALVARVEESLFGKGAGHEFYVDGVDRHHAVNMSHLGG
ncbi:GTP 3',8-cyclase MoaA [Myxococcota bacterium]|nr:GTP 3',8-cyclase MoaA [Myxococcota bacterium]